MLSAYFNNFTLVSQFRYLYYITSVGGEKTYLTNNIFKLYFGRRFCYNQNDYSHPLVGGREVGHNESSNTE
jgi:hypothetical protein